MILQKNLTELKASKGTSGIGATLTHPEDHSEFCACRSLVQGGPFERSGAKHTRY